MGKYSRRDILKQIGAASAVVLSGRSVFALTGLLGADRDFEMLVVGDSLIAGQGLNEEDRFYNLTRTWLENEFFSGARQVGLKNLSHSGSQIYLAEKEKKAMSDAERETDEFYHREVNFSFPSIRTQIDIAKEEYEKDGKNPDQIDLVLLSGGITNVETSYIANGFKTKYRPLRKKIIKYCNHDMYRFLTEASKTFPNALFAVVGYYPFVSPKSSTGRVLNAVLELFEYPGFTKPIINNIVTKQFFKILHARMNKRSRIWLTESNRGFRFAIDRVNKETGKTTAVYIESPITEETTFETKNTLLWRMGKKGRSEDHLYDLRKSECSIAVQTMKEARINFSKRFCELSAIGHPNVEGSKAYADAVTKVLGPVLTEKAGS